MLFHIYILVSVLCLLALPFSNWKNGYNTYLADLFAVLVVSFIPILNFLALVGAIHYFLKPRKILIIKGKD